MKNKAATTQLNVVARAPFEVYYEGPASVVSATNRVGRFDILSGHADFFSVMSAGDVNIETADETVTFPISGGIICVRDDEVMLFVNM